LCLELAYPRVCQDHIYDLPDLCCAGTVQQYNSVPSDYFFAVEVFGKADCEKHSIRKNLFRK
jgi:hypothetical protein